MGRAARHINGRAILYADVFTDSMRHAIDETNRRRAKQLAYNDANHITPESIRKGVDMRLAAIVEADYVTVPLEEVSTDQIQSEEELRAAIATLETQMREAAKKFEFERAATLRDRIRSLKQRDLAALSNLSSTSSVDTSDSFSENGETAPAQNAPHAGSGSGKQ
jgi:excinuclease ABC subunit B